MDQKLLTFLTLCRTMNYRRAADALHLTQPAGNRRHRLVHLPRNVRDIDRAVAAVLQNRAGRDSGALRDGAPV